MNLTVGLGYRRCRLLILKSMQIEISGYLSCFQNEISVWDERGTERTPSIRIVVQNEERKLKRINTRNVEIVGREWS